MRNSPKFIDLFSGCGGLSLGFLMAGFESLLALDADSQAVYCYNLNLKSEVDKGAVQVDLNQFRTKEQIQEFLTAQGVTLGECDVLIGGPHCQSFSVVGRNKTRALVESNGDLGTYWENKHKERTSLFNVYARFVEVLAPRWFLFENVPTIQSHKIFPRLEERFSQMKGVNGDKLNYHITKGLYFASDFGVPQDRRRFIMVGRRGDLDNPEWQPPVLQKKITVGEALGDLPSVTAGHNEKIMPYGSIPGSAYQKKMRNLPAWVESIAYKKSQVYDHICRKHNSDDIRLFKKMGSGAKFADPEVQKALRQINPDHKLIKYSTEKFKDKLHKLDSERPAWTVTAHLQKDCYKFIHYQDPRTITVREACRLQSFPDWFRFGELAMCPSFRLIGNAVPPIMAQAFAESFLEADNKMGREFYGKSFPNGVRMS